MRETGRGRPAMLDAPLSGTPRRDYWPGWPVTRINVTPLTITVA